MKSRTHTITTFESVYSRDKGKTFTGTLREIVRHLDSLHRKGDPKGAQPMWFPGRLWEDSSAEGGRGFRDSSLIVLDVDRNGEKTLRKVRKGNTWAAIKHSSSSTPEEHRAHVIFEVPIQTDATRYRDQALGVAGFYGVGISEAKSAQSRSWFISGHKSKVNSKRMELNPSIYQAFRPKAEPVHERTEVDSSVYGYACTTKHVSVARVLRSIENSSKECPALSSILDLTELPPVGSRGVTMLRAGSELANLLPDLHHSAIIDLIHREYGDIHHPDELNTWHKHIRKVCRETERVELALAERLRSKRAWSLRMREALATPKEEVPLDELTQSIMRRPENHRVPYTEKELADLSVCAPLGLYAGRVHCIAAAAGVGKTGLISEIVRAVASSSPCMGLETNNPGGSGVVLLTGEQDERGANTYIGRVLDAHGSEYPDNLDVLDINRVLSNLAEDYEGTEFTTLDVVLHLMERSRLLVIDTLLSARLLDDLSIDSVPHILDTMARIRAKSVETKCAVVALSHTTKAANIDAMKDPFGARKTIEGPESLHGQYGQIWYLTRDNERSDLKRGKASYTLVAVKHNEYKPTEPVYYIESDNFYYTAQTKEEVEAEQSEVRNVELPKVIREIAAKMWRDNNKDGGYELSTHRLESRAMFTQARKQLKEKGKPIHLTREEFRDKTWDAIASLPLKQKFNGRKNKQYIFEIGSNAHALHLERMQSYG